MLIKVDNPDRPVIYKVIREEAGYYYIYDGYGVNPYKKFMFVKLKVSHYYNMLWKARYQMVNGDTDRGPNQHI